MNIKDKLRAVKRKAHRPGRWIYASSLLIWGIVPPLVMAILLISPRTFVGSPLLWIIPAIIWAFSSLIVFFVITVQGFRETHSATGQFLQSLLSLTCTFSLGIPSILLSSIPLFGPSNDFLESLDPNGTELHLPSGPVSDNATTPEVNTMYIVGIDLSSSFINSQSDDRLLKVYRTLDSLFSENNDSSLADSMRPKDLIVYYGIAEKIAFLHTNEENGRAKEGRRLKLPSSQLPPYVSAALTSNSIGQRDTTDLMGFIDKVSSDINDNLQGYARVRVLIFSDLHHSVPSAGTGNTTATPQSSEEQRLASFQKLRDRLGHAQGTIISLWLDPHGGSRELLSGQDIDIGSDISSVLKNAWSEVNLDQYDEAKPQEKALLCVNLYGSVNNPGTLYLKYLTQPWQPRASKIFLPNSREDDRLFIGLRSANTLTSDIKIELGVGQSAQFGLNSKGGKNSFKFMNRKSSDQNPLQVQIGEEPANSRDTRGELLIAVPKRSTLYKIPLVALPVAEAGTINSVKVVLSVLHLFPLFLAVAIIWSTRERKEATARSVSNENSSALAPAAIPALSTLSPDHSQPAGGPTQP